MARFADPSSAFTDHSATADPQDLRSVAESLLTTPVDQESLRRSVWAFVSAERSAGTSAGRVIVTLTDLLDAAKIAPSARQPLMRRVILWCVEAYFGHLGGDVVGRDSDSLGDLPAVVSNR